MPGIQDPRLRPVYADRLNRRLFTDPVGAGPWPLVQVDYGSLLPLPAYTLLGRGATGGTPVPLDADVTIALLNTATAAVIDAARVAAGSTSTAGVLQLTDSTNSTSTTTAATPNAVKAAYDLAAGALVPADIGVSVQGYDADTAKTDVAQTFTAAQTFGDNVTLNAQSDLRFADADSSNWVAFQAPATVANNVTWTLPAADGTTGQALVTDGAGTLSWAAAGGATTILYNRRPALHRGSLFYKTAATTISIVAGSVLNGHLYEAATAVTMPSHTNNTDYAIWQNPTTGALVGDASFTTAPAGATGGSIVGGYHYIPSGRPTAVNNGSPTAAAEILEFSLWDLTWRPACPDPRGMACIEGGFWMDLYLCGATSYAGSTFSAVPSSRIGLTIADGSSPPLVPAQYGGNGSTAYANGKWFTFAEVAASFGKRLPRWQEFSAAAFGAPEASSRGTDPGTVQWERVSKFGLAQATGTMMQWGQETCTAESANAWTTGTETDSRGQVYGPQTRAVVLGGSWNYASNSGSRCAAWFSPPWDSNSIIGARFAAGHLVLG